MTIKTMDQLVQVMNEAKESRAAYFAIRVKMEEFPEDETIINGKENFDAKLTYWQKVYDENLQHRFSKGISIVKAAWGFDYNELNELLD